MPGYGAAGLGAVPGGMGLGYQPRCNLAAFDPEYEEQMRLLAEWVVERERLRKRGASEPSGASETSNPAFRGAAAAPVDEFAIDENLETCTDKNDNGWIGPLNAAGQFLKGMWKGLGGAVKNAFCDEEGFSFTKTALTVGLGTASWLCPPFGIALCSIGAVTGTYQAAKGIYNAMTADTDGQSKAGWQNAGAGVFSAGLSILGAKASFNAMTEAAKAGAGLSRVDALLKAAKAPKLLSAAGMKALFSKAGMQALWADAKAATVHNCSKFSESAFYQAVRHPIKTGQKVTAWFKGGNKDVFVKGSDGKYIQIIKKDGKYVDIDGKPVSVTVTDKTPRFRYDYDAGKFVEVAVKPSAADLKAARAKAEPRVKAGEIPHAGYDRGVVKLNRQLVQYRREHPGIMTRVKNAGSNAMTKIQNLAKKGNEVLQCYLERGYDEAAQKYGYETLNQMLLSCISAPAAVEK